MQNAEVPSPLRATLLGVAFLAELCLLFGLAWAGWSMGPNRLASVALMVLLPSVVAVLWGVWLAPNAERRLKTPARWAVKVTLFATAFVLVLGYCPGVGAGIFATAMWFLFLISLPADRAAD